MCLVLFSWITEQQYFKDYTDINTLMSLREKTEEEMEQDMSPFGFVFDGREQYIDEEYEQFVSSNDGWLLREHQNF
jgi:hypothetical protein